MNIILFIPQKSPMWHLLCNSQNNNGNYYHILQIRKLRHVELSTSPKSCLINGRAVFFFNPDVPSFKVSALNHWVYYHYRCL